MLSILKRGTAVVGTTTWEFHQDNDNPSIVYVTPQPQFAVDSNGLPRIQIVTMKTNDPTTNGSGYAQLVVELGVPDGVTAALTPTVNQLFGISSPIFQTLPVQAGTIVNITYPDGMGGTVGAQVDGTDFGSNCASFQLQLTAAQVNNIVAVMGKQGGSPFQIEYVLSVPSFMPAVTVQINFDASIAFQYQVTAVPHTKWAHSTTYTYNIQEYLTQSGAGTVTVNVIDPTTPASVVTALQAWGQGVIEDLVAKQVQEALAIQAHASGDQSFDVNQLASFSEWYAQNETIPWRIHPESVLPSFGDLGLTTQQIAQLVPPAIDDRQFTITVLPNVSFSGTTNGTSPQLQPSKNPFFDNIQKVKQLDVTIVYPGLESSATKTFSFTSNSPNTWTCAWDTTAQGVCTIQYVATYEDGQQTTGTIADVDVTNYTLGLADIGTLNVTFDATGFFSVPQQAMSTSANNPGADPSNKQVIKSITVDLIFTIPNQPPLLQSLVLDEKTQTQSVQSWSSAPITAGYQYVIQYQFKDGSPPFTTDVQQQNGQYVRIDGPVTTQPIAILVNMGVNSANFVQFGINVYYNQPPLFPPQNPNVPALPAPTNAAQQTFSFTAPDSNSPLARAQLNLFRNSSASLTLLGQGTDANLNTVTWGPVNFSPKATTTLPFTAANLFAFVEFDPSAVDWQVDPKTGVPGLTEITLIVNSVTATVGTTKVPGVVSSLTQHMTWEPGAQRAPSMFAQVTQLGKAYDSISFDWTASYTYAGKGTFTTTGTQLGSTVVLPLSVTSNPPPPPPK